MSKRRHGEPLTRDRIVAGAVDLADRHGYESVSMRKVAEHLGSGTMSLYRHIADKDELVAAMVEQVATRHSYPEPGDTTWREQMHALAQADWQAFQRHPWLLAATASTAPPFGTESLAAMEWALTALEPLCLPAHETARAIMTVNNYVQGSARVALGDRNPDTGDDIGHNWRQRLATVDLAEHPRLARLVSQPPPTGERDWFHDGLDVILDGIEARAGDPESTGLPAQTRHKSGLDDFRHLNGVLRFR